VNEVILDSSRVSIAKFQENNNNNCPISIFGFQCVAHEDRRLIKDLYSTFGLWPDLAINLPSRGLFWAKFCEMGSFFFLVQIGRILVFFGFLSSQISLKKSNFSKNGQILS